MILSKKMLNSVFALTTLTMTTLLFQNCGENFSPAGSNISSSSQSLGLVIPNARYNLTVPLGGKTYYVSNSGSDSRSCTTARSISTPKKTLASAVACLLPGDTLYIRAGTYAQILNLMDPSKTGTSSAWLKISGYPGEVVTLKPTNSDVAGYGIFKARGKRGYILLENLILDGANLGNKTQGVSLRDGNHHITLSKVEIKNHKGTAVGINGSYIQILNCKLHNNISLVDEPLNRHYGVYLRAGSNIVLEGNSVYKNDGGGIQVYYGPTSKVIIRNNRIYENNKLKSSKIAGITVMSDGGNTINDVQIYNNLIYLNGINQPSTSHAGGIGIFYSSNVKIWNNTVYGNHGGGIKVVSSSSSLVQNNISYSNRDSENYFAEDNTNVTADHNVLINPKFVSITNRDFRLTSTSPARDSGRSISTVSKDILGVARPRGPAFDVGAYEY